MNIVKKSLAVATLATLFTSGIVFAKDATVEAEGTKFTPLIVNVDPGDTVYWTNMTIHNVDFMFQPEGAEAFKSEIGQDTSRVFTKEGVYIYQCDPHIGLGMGGAVIVGNPSNLEELKATKFHGGLHMISHKAIKAAEKK
jgi:pseudoazurin